MYRESPMHRQYAKRSWIHTIGVGVFMHAVYAPDLYCALQSASLEMLTAIANEVNVAKVSYS